MKSDLSSLELAILLATLKQYAGRVPLQGFDPAKLKVLRREPSGVGTYIVLSREEQAPPQPDVCHQLGFSGEIKVPDVASGLGAVVDIDSGQVNHIELFTYGNETWNGDTSQGTVAPDSSPQAPRG